MPGRDFDFNGEADKLLLAARFIADLNLDGITETIERAHALGSALDPTQYRDAVQRGDLDLIARLAHLLKEPAAYFRDEVLPHAEAATRG